jgi:sugar lactone lactonase YvrE
VGYRWVKFPVNTPVTRGKTYYFKFSNQSGINYFYTPGTTYGYGRLYLGGSPYPAMDLCCRVTGVNSTDSTFWGMNGYVAGIWGDATRDSVTTQAKWMGINITREQMEWRTLKPTKDGAYNWDRADSGFYKARNKGIRVMINFFGSPAWASSKPPSVPDDSACLYPPKNLDKPLGDTANYLWQFACSLANHYKADSFRVHDYEIWNEMNFYDWFRYGIGRDTFFYKQLGYSCDQPGRAQLYVRACLVAKDAIRSADPQARIYTNAVLHMNIPTSHPQTDSNIAGRYWMQYYYDKGGKDIADVITRHWYQDLCWGSTHRFLPGRFIADYDTLRRVMRDNGEGSKPVWADEGGWGSPAGYDTGYFWKVSRPKQADIAVQAFVTGLGQLGNEQGPAIGQVNWYQLYDCYPYSPDSIRMWEWHAGLLEQWWNGGSGPNPYKPSGYAYKQMTGKLKDKYFNRRVPLADTNVYCYEFQRPGPDTSKKTWAVWRAVQGAVWETLSVRTNTAYYDSTYYSSSGSPRVDLSYLPYMQPNGKVAVPVDTVPIYVSESLAVSRPDVIVDSLWLVPSNPKAGEGLRFYARIKNLSKTDSLKAGLADTVIFQVDGVTKTRYAATRGLDTLGGPKDTLTVGMTLSGSDWQANYGDHLIRAWADSADRYVELREDNNQGYIFKHIRPKVSLIINNNAKYSNHLSNNSVSVVINGNTSPNPDSTYFWHESGPWTKIPKTSSFDTLVTYSGNGVMFDSVIVFQGADRDTAGDSIIVDASAPYTYIISPSDSQTVSGNVEFWGWSYDFENHDSLWEIWENSYAWVYGNEKVGTNPWFGFAGQFGTWHSTNVGNGWHTHTLVSRDSAVNFDTTKVHVYVNNGGGGGNDGFASGFGSFGSSPVNVATDASGNLYTAETQGSMIRKHSPRRDTLFSFSAKRGNDSTGLAWATALAIKDSTTLWIADGYAHAIKRFDRQGNLLLRFGSFGSDTGHFKQPCGIALDWKGRLWITDRGNNRIQVYDTTGAYLFGFGGLGSDSGKVNSPTGIAITKDRLVYITDTKNHQLQVFDSLGNWKKTIKHPDSLGFDTPTGICVDKHGDIFIADTKHNRIVELNPYGRRLFTFGEQGDSLWQFRNPVGVTSSPGGHYLYVADLGNKRVQRFWVIRGDTLGGGGPQSKDAVRLPPKVTYLSQSYPNPTTGKALIEYGLAKESEVRLVIYNVAGQVVREYNQGKQKAWYYSITWDGRSNLGHRVGAGVYFYRLTAGNWAKTRKMVVIR